MANFVDNRYQLQIKSVLVVDISSSRYIYMSLYHSCISALSLFVILDCDSVMSNYLNHLHPKSHYLCLP